ncbi:MAG: hypothetical protein NVSMB13_05730 [Mycobacteriales bacterium]
MSEEHAPATRRLRLAIRAGCSRVLVVVALLSGLFAMQGLHSGHGSASAAPLPTHGALTPTLLTETLLTPTHGGHEITAAMATDERSAGLAAGSGPVAWRAVCLTCTHHQFPIAELCIAVLLAALVWMRRWRASGSGRRPRERVRSPEPPGPAFPRPPVPLRWCVSRT